MINWKKFKAALAIQGLTIKEWCEKHHFNQDRLKNIKFGKIKNITNEEIQLFEKTIKDIYFFD